MESNEFPPKSINLFLWIYGIINTTQSVKWKLEQIETFAGDKVLQPKFQGLQMSQQAGFIDANSYFVRKIEIKI